jgi:hypothetical protein
VVKKMAGTPVPPVSVFTGASTLVVTPNFNTAEIVLSLFYLK